MPDFQKRYNIAYYSINDPLDKRSWSGITYYMGNSLQKHVGEVDFLGPVKIPWLLEKIIRGVQKIVRVFTKTEWIPKYSLLKNIYAARKLKSRMKGRAYDFLIAPAAASELAYLYVDLPIIYYGDATYKLYSEMYKREFKNINSVSRKEGEHLEKKALQKSNLVLFSSQWAAQSAVKDYGINPSKIDVIQLGANIDQTPSREIIFSKECNKVLTLLFLSVDWERKGGPIAFDCLKVLHAMGLSAKLIVCGCTPPEAYQDISMEVMPFLNKNEPADLKLFTDLLSSVHFLLLPTRADCTPLVNCEANSYGVPAITTNVGGINEAVKDGVNGYCMPMQAGGEEYASLINEIYADKARYHQLIESSREMFDRELNWDKFADNFRKVLTKNNI